MKTKKVESLQENEILALPVCTEEGEVLLPKGTELKREYMDILISLNIAEIQIEDKYSFYEQPTWLITETEKETYARIERGAWGGGLREYGSIFTDQFHTGDCAAHDAP